MKYIAYYRVSTSEQGDSGLGIEAQKRQVAQLVKGDIIAEYTEIESGKNNRRPILKAAMSECRKNKATLVIAKLDRLSRNATFISNLLDFNVPFLCADVPSMDSFTMRIFGSVAQKERELISARTKAALKSLKERGVKLGGPNKLTAEHRAMGRKAVKEKWGSLERSTTAKAHSVVLREQGMSLQKIADALNEAGYLTVKHSDDTETKGFTAMQVSRLLK